MKTKYSDLAEQVFNLPNAQFEVDSNKLIFNSIDFSENLPHQSINNKLARLLMDNFSSSFEIH